MILLAAKLSKSNWVILDISRASGEAWSISKLEKRPEFALSPIMDVRELRTRPVGNPKGIDKVTVLED